MLVSVIIPIYNRSEIIKDTITSVLNQTYTKWELIIVDDGSTDKTLEVLQFCSKLDNRISYYVRPYNLKKGANSCRNYGLLKSNGELIKWVDSDDILTPDSLNKQVNVFEFNDKVKMCLGYGGFFPNELGMSQFNWSRNNVSFNYFSDHIINKIRWPIGAVMWKRVFLNDNPFDIRLSNSQEWLMHSVQLLKLNSDEIYNLKDINYLIRRGHSRISSSFSHHYFINQLKARLILLTGFKKISIYDKYQLLKQCLVYIFYSIKYYFK